MQYNNWFILDQEKQDYENVIHFVSELPKNFNKIIFNPENNFVKTFLKNDNINEKLLESVFNESHEELLKNIKFVKELDLKTSSQLYDDINYSRYNYSMYNYLITNNIQFDEYYFHFTLNRIGFVKDSLKIKSLRLNELWNEIVNFANNFTEKIINFSNNEIVKLMRKFLTYLNSLLGSLTNLFPSLDSMKEFKEIIESYLSIADN